jgi:hypothetical protein
VTQGPTVIHADLQSYAGPADACPLTISSPDAVVYSGTIDMKNCDYAFPIHIKHAAAKLKLERATLLQNLGTGNTALRNTIYGTTTGYGIRKFSSGGGTITNRGVVLSNAAIESGFTLVGVAPVIDAAVT